MRIADGLVIVNPSLLSSILTTTLTLTDKVKLLVNRCTQCGSLPTACTECSAVLTEFQTLIVHVQSIVPQDGMIIRKEIGN